MTRRSNPEWLTALRAPGLARESALADLRALLLAGLPYALAGWLSPDAPQFQALAEDVIQETLLRVLNHLDTFEGRSQFTTWAHKIAVRVALTELRRRRWQDVSLESLTEMTEPPAPPGLLADPAAGPEAQAEQADLLAYMARMLEEELTHKQLRAMRAVGQGMPLEEVARRMGMKRNALYKLLHDARLRLRRRLERDGLSPGQLLANFAGA